MNWFGDKNFCSLKRTYYVYVVRNKYTEIKNFDLLSRDQIFYLGNELQTFYYN